MNKQLFPKIISNKNPKILILIACSIIGVLGAGVFILFSLFGGNDKLTISDWKDAKSAPIEKAVKESIAKSGFNLESAKVLAISLKKETTYLVNPNSTNFCGTGGCLVKAYNAKGGLVFSYLLDLNLPKGFNSLIVPGTITSKNCFAILQAVSDMSVSKNEFCKEGEEFHLLNISVESLEKNNEPKPTPTPDNSPSKSPKSKKI